MGTEGFQNGGRKLVVGIGSALVDILARESDDFLKAAGGAKGGMLLVDHECIEQALSKTSEGHCTVPGGSACNTVIGIGRLGGRARFVGKLGRDELGRRFESCLKESNVEPVLFLSTCPTGRVLSIITPDAQRSMFTCLGASSQTLPEEISGVCFDDAAIVHIEGYLLFNRDLILAALSAAKKAGARVSLDLSSFTVVEENREFIDRIVEAYVDILIANEDEARAYTEHSDEMEAICALSEKAELAVLKLGARGSIIAHRGKLIRIDPRGNGDAVDTTGAGDLWAAGFLFGLVSGLPLERCGELASACGYEVCQVMGANIPEEGWQRIQAYLECIAGVRCQVSGVSGSIGLAEDTELKDLKLEPGDWKLDP